jgi:hypothetical protein
MLSDHERDRLGAVERDVLADDPDFARSFRRGQARLGRAGNRRAALAACGVAAVLSSLLWMLGAPDGALAVAVTVGAIWLAWRCSAGNSSRPAR